jgi:MFS family permease
MQSNAWVGCYVPRTHFWCTVFGHVAMRLVLMTRTIRRGANSFEGFALNAPPQAAIPSAPAKQSFAALRYPGYRAQFFTYVLAMMADNIEHVISYWMVFQKFHSPALAGFAVVSHWLPFLMFSVAAGALADRFDPRRVIQCGMALFISTSLGWGYFFITDTLEMWHAMVLLIIHGCAGVLWQTPSQLLLYDIVGPADLMSAVRLNATARYLGVLVGPAIGGLIMLALGPSHGILLNTLFYLPVVLWLVNAPYGPRFRRELRRLGARCAAWPTSCRPSATFPGSPSSSP